MVLSSRNLGAVRSTYQQFPHQAVAIILYVHDGRWFVGSWMFLLTAGVCASVAFRRGLHGGISTTQESTRGITSRLSSSHKHGLLFPRLYRLLWVGHILALSLRH